MELSYLTHQSRSKAWEAMQEMTVPRSLPGRVPVGYRTITENGKRNAIVDEEKAGLIRLAFGMVATEERPLRELLKELTAYGLLSRTGKRMGISSFWGILTNPFYAGMIRYKGEIVQGLHEPLVDKRLFDIVQIRLRERNRSHRSRARAFFKHRRSEQATS